ncbi:hypothetical protein JOE56_000838 [Brevibacterium paucivorans]|uniref:Uncharacterized protein n=1 Tax=Brevibacterium paucivorans TaxID=170994 RepID=A0ABS2SIQ8_9MICO|nr:hypothetical protein [Brevibacterium paucivorans]
MLFSNVIAITLLKSAVYVRLTPRRICETFL